jgi:hypothetical protein
MAATYEVVTQQDRTVSVGGGVFEHQVRVTFKTKPSGITSYVDVVVEPGWLDTLPALLAEAAQEREQVMNL